MLVNPKLKLRQCEVTWSTRPPNKRMLVLRRINGWFWRLWRNLFPKRRLPTTFSSCSTFNKRYENEFAKEAAKRQQFLQDVLDNLEKSGTLEKGKECLKNPSI